MIEDLRSVGPYVRERKERLETDIDESGCDMLNTDIGLKSQLKDCRFLRGHQRHLKIPLRPQQSRRESNGATKINLFLRSSQKQNSHKIVLLVKLR